MKKTTQKCAKMLGAVLVVLVALELPAIINPTPLSRARERALVQAGFFSIALVGIEIFAKE